MWLDALFPRDQLGIVSKRPAGHCALHSAGYSLWTNCSFKRPLIAASLACIVGNLLYIMGYDAKALWILLGSRLMVGFGRLLVHSSG